LGSVSSLVSEKKIFEISANQSILLALAGILNIRLERMPCNFEVNVITRLGVIALFSSFFSSPDPKGHVRYCHCPSSIHIAGHVDLDKLNMFSVYTQHLSLIVFEIKDEKY
jgi:hypothetical protein